MGGIVSLIVRLKVGGSLGAITELTEGKKDDSFCALGVDVLGKSVGKSVGQTNGSVLGFAENDDEVGALDGCSNGTADGSMIGSIVVISQT